MEKISPYYSYFIKGSIDAKSTSMVKIKIAAENLEKSLTYKKTEEAYELLANCYIKLNNIEAYKKTCILAVENGFNIFCSSCGIFYANNASLANEEKSLYWFNKGIEEGEAKCCYDLGRLYSVGCKVFKKDVKKAEEVFLKGLVINDPKWNGYFNWFLGTIRFDNKEYGEALEYFKKAIEQGCFHAYSHLAILYRDGLGVEKNLNLYIESLLKDINVESALAIAGIFLHGEYVEKDDDIASSFFNYAAKKGNAIGAMMCAAFLVDSGDYDEKVLNQYLEIAFRNGATDQNMKEHYNEIEEYFGEKAGKLLQEKAEKYWLYKKNLC